VSLFFTEPHRPGAALTLPVALLAHLGDAVFHLYERERAIFKASTAKDLHGRVNRRVNAEKQAELLDSICEHLSEQELDLVRRARNIKASNLKRALQAVSRKATAFEALLGFLYLEDPSRLQYILSLTAVAD
jgi:ribonuclease-3 family protein